MKFIDINRMGKLYPYYIGKRMRFIFYTIALLLISSYSFAQSERVSISLEDATVVAVINEIRNQTDINFVYNHEELGACSKITIELENVTVEEALKQSLKTCGFTYNKVNNTIVIMAKKEASMPIEKPKPLTQTIRGKVIDRESNITLPFANVVVSNTNPKLGTTTDVDGNFKIENLPEGRYTLQVSYVGYEVAIVPEVQLGTAKETYVTIAISEKLSSIDEVTVSVKKGEPLNEMATVSAKSFSVEETKRYPVSIGDPARMAQVFAGVSTNDDASNEIVIRGNSPNWMLWRLEGVEIPSPNHFAEEGYSSGAVSILNSATLGTSDFYTGAFPGEYGNSLSGVFDIKLRNGNNEKGEYAFQVGVLGVEAAAEGPLKKGYAGSYLINYRYSTFSLINHLNLNVVENSLPSYQDLSFKVNLPTEKAGTFSLWGIGGQSTDDQKYEPDTAAGDKFEYGYKDYTQTGMYATGISHVIFPDQKSYFKTVLSYSSSYSSQEYALMDTLGVLNDDFYDNLQKKASRFTTFYNRKVSKNLTLRTGGVVSLLDYDYFTEEADSNGIFRTSVNSQGNTNLYQAYLQGKYKFSDKVLMTAGLHYTYFALNGDNALEPRLGMLVKLPKKQKITMGYGQHSKHENLPVYFVDFENPDGTISQLNKNLELTRSSHFVIGYEKMLGKSLNIKSEVYYQHINNLPVPTNPDKYWSPAFGGFNPEDTLANIGKGRNYGAELTFQKFFTNNYYFLITSSLFEAEYQAADGQWRNSRYNINYVNNFVGGKDFKWGNNKMVGINGKIIWSGGKRLIPIDLEASIEKGETVVNMNDLFSEKGPDYFRIDLGLKLHIFKTKTEHIISVDIQNLTNRWNVWGEFYNKEDEAIEEFPMAGIIPVLSYRIQF